MSYPTEIFIFRHGETNWNVERRFQGHTDIPLNENGRLQARGLGEIVKSLGIDLVLSSDLQRASETAEIAFKNLGVPIQLYEELREASLGEPEGWLVSEIIDKYGEQFWEKWISVSEDDLDFGFPGGESKRSQLKRVCDFLESIAANSNFERIAVSSHGGVLRRLIHNSVGAPQSPVPIPNCKVHKLLLETDKWIYKGDIDR